MMGVVLKLEVMSSEKAAMQLTKVWFEAGLTTRKVWFEAGLIARKSIVGGSRGWMHLQED